MFFLATITLIFNDKLVSLILAGKDKLVFKYLFFSLWDIRLYVVLIMPAQLQSFNFFWKTLYNSID
jgi:helix-turn-helix protein